MFVSGLAPSMELLVAGRFAQGLGSGAMTVALYVIVARVYPQHLHPAIFAAFAAAWVVPSLVGPTIAALVTDVWGWRWVFLGVFVLALTALLMVVPVLRGTSGGDANVPWALARLGWSVLAAVAVLVLDLAGDVPGTGPLFAVIAAAIALLAVRSLVPRGALRARRGLPAAVLVRGLAAGAFFGAQVYVPYLLTDAYGLSPTVAGLALTGGALAWSAASSAQGRMAARLSNVAALRIGTALLLAGVVVVLATAAFRWSALAVAAAWLAAGCGMGLTVPRSSVLTLALSTSADQGFNSAALTVADSFGSALVLAIAGTVSAALASITDPFTGVFVLTAVFAAAAFAVAPRADARPRRP